MNTTANTLPKEMTEEAFYRLALNYVPGIGVKLGKALLDRFGSAVGVFNASMKALVSVPGISEPKVQQLRDDEIFRKTEKEAAFIAKNNIRTFFITDEDYPKRLANCADAPLMLFYKGNANLDAKRIVAIVGTRKNTEYGVQLCEELVQGLQGQEDVLVVSGLAYGIDAVAHKKSVALGMPTIGVMAHGLDRIYPPMHKNLANEMVECGGLLTEYTTGTIPDKGSFPARNRIVAGMSDITVVVESDRKGGALITAHMASSYNREVAAFPGRVNDNRSAGCNELIRTNIAAMITGADDLLELMNWGKPKKQKTVQKQLLLNLSEEEQKVIDILQQKDAVHADELFYQTGIATPQLAAILLQLEMQGIIKALPGKQYRIY